MAEIINGYSGGFNGVQLVRGIAVASPSIPSFRPFSHPVPAPELESVLARATTVIGTRERATRWLGTPVRALDYATPISRLHDAEGTEEVLAVLDQLEHGVL
jgi:hypothetical protein